MGWRDPLEQSEFEIQALAFFKLKEKYKNVRGEFHYKYNGKQAARFDIAILNDQNELEIIIEVKSKHTDKNWKQVAKYSGMTGKPALYIKGAAQAQDAANIVQQYMKSLGKLELHNSLCI